jgi:hypothetical protein
MPWNVVGLCDLDICYQGTLGLQQEQVSPRVPAFVSDRKGYGSQQDSNADKQRNEPE